jgi:hypothetical protein
MALTDNLVAWWDLEEASGARSDAHASFDLTDNNTVAQTTGRVGNGALFVRANQEWLSIANASAGSLLFGDTDFTIALWVYPNSLSVNQALVSVWNATGNQRSYYLRFETAAAGLIRCVLSNNGTGSTNCDSGASNTPTISTWNLIIVRHNAAANTVTIEVNNSGSPDSTSHSGGAFASSTANFNLGRIDSATNVFLDSRLDSVGIWSRVLTPTEGGQLWNSGSGLNYAGLSGGTTHQSAVSEAVSLTATEARVMTTPQARAEAVSLSDTAARVMTTTAARAEAVSLTDSQSAIKAVIAALSEALSLSETAARTVTVSLSLSDAVSLSDGIAGAATYPASRSEALALSDTVARIATFAAAAAESISLTATPAVYEDTIDLPDGRTLTITAEGRTLTVSLESRILTA